MVKKHKFKFSIIMSVYDTEQWIEEAVESVIGQDIGFVDNVQLIFVNDGSPDNSEAICQRYAKQYPKNIIYVRQDNQGLSAARNTGLTYREGKYINFFDPDDVLVGNVLSEVWKFFEAHYGEVNSVAIPLEYFEARTGYHPRYELLGTTNRVINLNDEPAHAVLSSASSFYKTQVFEKLSYDITMFGSEDVKFNAQQYESCPRFGYVCENGVKYCYRIRKSANSIVSQLAYRPESFRTVKYLFEFLCNEKESIEPYKQEIIIYELRSRLATIRPEYFDKPGEFDEIVTAYKRYLHMVEPERLISSPFIQTNPQRYMFASNVLETNPKGLTATGKIYFDNSRNPTNIIAGIHAKNIEFTKDGLKLDILFQDFNLPNLTIAIRGERTGELKPSKVNKVEGSRYDIRYGAFHICGTTYYQYLIPYDRVDTFHFYTRDEEQKKDFPIERIGLHPYSRFVLNSKFLKIWHGNVRARLYENNLEVSHSPRRRLFNNLTISLLLFRRHRKLPLMRLMNRNNKKYLLFSDRPQSAKDNAEALFKYVNKHDTLMSRYSYFVLDKGSPDLQRLKKIGKVVRKGSLKHKYLYLNARLVISSHLHPLFLEPFERKDMFMYRDLMISRLVWLQHGITMNDVAGAANKFNELPYRTVVASEHEVKEFSRPEYYYSPEQLIKSGFPRFDDLYSGSERIVTVMPTWRTYVAGAILKTGSNERREGFEETEYYQVYKDLLNDKDLLRALKSRGYKLRFVLHPGVSAYASSFKQFKNEVVDVIDTSGVDYAKIFAETSLLVTDYSSVFFDFSYLYKPILLYQFDQDQFFGKHYHKSDTFSYETDAPGRVVENHSDVIAAIIEQLDSGCRLEPQYKKRIDNLFLYHDDNNSKRVHEGLLGLLE